MPKDGVKKLGDPRFDRKQDISSLPKEIQSALKVSMIFELMLHFKINPKNKNAWMHLSFKLAEHYVPAMQSTKRRGQPKKWDWVNELPLYALVEELRIRHPKISKKKIFNLVPEAAQKTPLSNIISQHSKALTLQSHYDHFFASKAGKDLRKVFDKYPLDVRLEAFQHILSD